MAAKVLTVGLEAWIPDLSSLDPLSFDSPALGDANLRRDRLEHLGARHVERALEILVQEEIAVLVLGPELSAAAAARLLQEAAARAPASRRLNVVLSENGDLSPFQRSIDEDQIYYLSPRPLSSRELRPILRSAIERYRALRGVEEGAGGGAQGDAAQRLLALARQLSAQRDISGVSRLTSATIRELLGADRAHCLVYDAEEEILWTEEEPDGDRREESAATGLCSFVVRTGQSLRVPRFDADPRCDTEADNPDGEPRDRFLAAPVVGAGRRVLAVLVALRGEEEAEFTATELRLLERAALQVAHALGRLELQSEVQSSLTRAGSDAEVGFDDIFRREALEQQRFGHQGQGEILRLLPRWIQPAFYLLLALVVGELLFSIFGRIDEFAEGPALVRARGKTEVTALDGGRVERVAVEPGQRVAAGEVLVRFYDAREVADVERTKREFELRLVDLLQDPGDEATLRILAGLRAQYDLARSRLEERAARAPHDGVVSDILVKPGQHIAPGERLVSLVNGDTAYTVVVLVPGYFRPQIEVGGALRLEMDGYEHAYQDLVVTRVADQVIGPAEARRYLGPQVADSIGVTGPVVLVQADLAGQGFRFGGEQYPYHDGMFSTARLRLRSERILLSLVPGLRAVFGKSDG